MKQLINNSIDWVSIKLNMVCMLGFLTGNEVLSLLAGIATASTIAYNSIRIYKEFKNKKDGIK